MAYEEVSEKKCFTFIWKLENASYCWHKGIHGIKSPSFNVDEIYETNWNLELNSSFENRIGLWLKRVTDYKKVDRVKIDCELSFLSSDGTVLLLAFQKKNVEVATYDSVWNHSIISRNEIFVARRSEFLPQDTLTVRCKMWNSVGEMSKEVQCVARKRIAVEKRSFLWSITNFSNRILYEKQTYEIKSNDGGENIMLLELFITGGWLRDETICFKITPNNQKIKICTFQLCVVDSPKSNAICFKDEFHYLDPFGTKEFTFFCTKKELLEKENLYLPNNVLSISCECAFAFGYIHEQIEKIVDSDCGNSGSVDTENKRTLPFCVLIDDLKSMLNNKFVSDVTIRTKSQTYSSHIFILSARSPVFKVMFSNDTEEKNKGCVDILDFSDGTVSRMLRFIYSAEVEELEWATATELYEAADKYQILNLKDLCSSYLKRNLCANNACETLLLADLHHDQNLICFVQDFVLRHGEDIINSEEWEHLAGSNLKLAYETMRLKYKK